MGVLSIWALPKFSSSNEFKERNFFDETMTAIRYAQKLAIASGCPVEFNLSLGSGFWLERSATTSACNSGPYSTRVKAPGESSGTNYENSDVPDSFTAITATTIVFYAQGWACNSAGTSDTTQTITFNNGSFTRSIQVECGTGYVRKG